MYIFYEALDLKVKIKYDSCDLTHIIWAIPMGITILDKPCLAKTQKSGFFGQVLSLENSKVRIFWKNAIFQKLKTTNFAQKQRQ